jgi:hypothetical protein
MEQLSACCEKKQVRDLSKSRWISEKVVLSQVRACRERYARVCWTEEWCLVCGDLA